MRRFVLTLSCPDRMGIVAATCQYDKPHGFSDENKISTYDVQFRALGSESGIDDDYWIFSY